MQYGAVNLRRHGGTKENGQKQGSARTFETIENTGSGPLTFDYRPMLAVGVPKPPLAENFDFEVGRLPMRCDHRSQSIETREPGTNVPGWFPELGQMPSDVSGSEMQLDGEVIVGNGSVESFNVLLRRRACAADPRRTPSRQFAVRSMRAAPALSQAAMRTSCTP
jgi:hypothetical protein